MKKRCLVFLLAAYFWLTLPAQAQEPPGSVAGFPAVAALEAAVVPPADVVDLARRFKGVTYLPTPAAGSQPVRTVGEEQTFWIINTDENREYQISATLRVVGEHIYVWVQSDAIVSDVMLQTLAHAFDTTIYPQVRDLWGSENTPGIDGDTRLYGLFAYGLGGGIAAYFSSRNTYPKVVWPTSNEHEMFLFNLDTLGTRDLAGEAIQGVVAHEFQHMIRDNIEVNEDIWLNEGFSSFTQLLLYGDAGSIPSFLNAPDTQLNDWPPGADTAPHYGAAALFVHYFYERFGKTALQQLSTEPERGLDAFDHVLKALGEPGVNSFFADWVLANLLRSPQMEDGRYGYRLLSDQFPAVQPVSRQSGSYDYRNTLNQYATNYHLLTNLQGQPSLTLQIEIPETARLIPADAPGGTWMWYSNRGDMSDTTLTRAVDLTAVQTASLHYKVWYETEAFYDYGYLTVSTDGGAHWTILSTPNSDTTNPVNAAYGPGYTGLSGGWRDETVSLDAYAGQNILIRFEWIADEGTTSRGMAVDSVSIPEIGYNSDFEQDDGGWQAVGWVRTDNRLPQQMWVQAVQQAGTQTTIQRWLAPQQTRWTLPLDPAVEQVVIALSPFAPVTNVPANYQLTVTLP